VALPAWLTEFIESIQDQFYLNFVKDDRYQYILRGLGVTLEVTFFAVLLGIALGIVCAIIRSTYDKCYLDMRRGFPKFILRVFNELTGVYLTVVRGTPVVVQLMIAYFVIFASSKNKVLVAILAFGINSGAYVAEIFRGGIMSIDNGQFEAGRSLGFNYLQTMRYIIIPQMFKATLPTLCNEFIALLKETSVAGYIAIADITKGGDIIRSQTFSAFMPLIAVALIYLIMVVLLTRLVNLLERRLASNDKR
jgi:His/Glu/Gln/Arg/opine family amino acid ABC transporter permease subunit